MKLSVAGKVAIQALTMLGISSLAKAQTCTDDASFVCGYIVDDYDMVVDGYFSVCLASNSIRKKESQCLKKADYPLLGPGDKVGKKTVLSCGCCGPVEADPPDYCDYEPLPCDATIFSASCSKLMKGKEKVKVEVCYVGEKSKKSKKNKQKTECLDPFENLGEEEYSLAAVKSAHLKHLLLCLRSRRPIKKACH
jgi:hypothetical protein